MSSSRESSESPTPSSSSRYFINPIPPTIHTTASSSLSTISTSTTRNFGIIITYFSKKKMINSYFKFI